jgi:hypothetical protein
MYWSIYVKRIYDEDQETEKLEILYRSIPQTLNSKLYTLSSIPNPSTHYS